MAIPDIILEKIDETYLRVHAEEGIIREMHSEFSYYVPNYKFMPKFRNSSWDGKIRLLNPYEKKIYLGLYKDIYKWAKDSGYSCEIDDSLLPSQDIQESDILEYLDYISLDKKFERREHQITPISKMLNSRRALLLSPTSSGKSLIIYTIARYLNEKFGMKILIVTPLISLVTQLAKDFREYNNGKEMDIHEITSGVEKKSKSKFTISTWQSIYKLSGKYFSEFDAVICDEAHHFEADAIKKILEKSKNASYKLGFTGTINDSELSTKTLTGLIGPISRHVTTKDLIEKGYISDLRIKSVVFQYSEHSKKVIHSANDYNKEIDFLVNHKKRNKFIAKLAHTRKKNTLILFRLIDHGKLIKEELEKITSKKIFFIYGKTDKELREEYRSLIEKEDNCIVLASYGTFSTGVNIKNLHNIIFASPYKSKIKVLQSIGRGLRLHSKGDVLTLFDLVDDLKYNGKMNIVLSNYSRRHEIYVKEGFNVSFQKIKIEHE